jgi:hypothetical protein
MPAGKILSQMNPLAKGMLAEFRSVEIQASKINAASAALDLNFLQEAAAN